MKTSRTRRKAAGQRVGFLTIAQAIDARKKAEPPPAEPTPRKLSRTGGRILDYLARAGGKRTAGQIAKVVYGADRSTAMYSILWELAVRGDVEVLDNDFFRAVRKTRGRPGDPTCSTARDRKSARNTSTTPGS